MANKKPTARVGGVVEIHFLDHAENMDSVRPVVVYGRVVHVERTAYKLHSWESEDETEHEEAKQDITSYWIIRSTITKLEVLKGNQ